MKGKHTLVIDGNYFLHRTVHVLPAPKKGEMILGTDKSVAIYIRKLATDLAYQIRLWDGLIGDIVWTLDSRSWRKDFFVEHDYKGTRKYSTDIDWNGFSKASEEFSKILAGHGVIVSKIDGAEGDDLIYSWHSVCNSMGRSLIILTGDRDLVQLVNINKSNESHTVLYAPVQSYLYTWDGFNEWLTEKEEAVDFFDSLRSAVSPTERTKGLFNQIITKKKLTIKEVNTVDFLFEKIVTGDLGDNVMPSYWHIKKDKNGNERMYKISDAKASLIVTELKKKYDEINFMYLFNDEVLEDLRNIIVRIMKAQYMSPETILNNLKNNVQLVVLSHNTIPESIVDAMFKNTYSLIESNNLNSLSSLTSMKSMLDNTDFSKVDVNVSASVLDDDDDDNDMSFITDRKKKGKLF